MSAENHGAPLPAAPDERWYDVISPKGADKLRVTILDDTFWGVWVHWEGTPFPCEMNEHCRYCKRGLGNRWQGYIGVWDMEKARRAVLALSEGAARQLLELKAKYGTLRGCRVYLKRRHAHRNNSPVDVYSAGTEPQKNLIAPHPLTDSLHRLWGFNKRREEQEAQAGRADRSPWDDEGVSLPQKDEPGDGERMTATEQQRVGEIVSQIGRQVQ